MSLFGPAIIAVRTQFRTLFAPVPPSVMPGNHMKPAILDAFPDSPEADGGSKVESGGSQYASHNPSPLNVEIAHQQAGHEPSHHAFHRHQVQPVPVPWQQSKHGRQKDDCQQHSHPSEHRRTTRTRMHPSPADPAQPQRQQKGRQAHRLKQDIAQASAEDSNPVVHGMRNRQIRSRVQRRVSRVPCSQCKQEEKRNQQQHKP